MAKDPSGGKDFAKEAVVKLNMIRKKLKNTGKKRKKNWGFQP